MRGSKERSEDLFSYVSCDARVPANHPLRPIRATVYEALKVMSPAFDGLHSKIGRPWIPLDLNIAPAVRRPQDQQIVLLNREVVDEAHR